MFYLLDENKQPYPVDITESYKLYDNRDMKITARNEIGDILISTVFLGMDHSPLFGPKDKPVLWETMIFGGEHDGYQERYTSHNDALVGHQQALDLVNKSEKVIGL